MLKVASDDGPSSGQCPLESSLLNRIFLIFKRIHGRASSGLNLKLSIWQSSSRGDQRSAVAIGQRWALTPVGDEQSSSLSDSPMNQVASFFFH